MSSQTWIKVRDHIPLEQGLRHSNASFFNAPGVRQRPYSIRTRIKTCLSNQAVLSKTVRDHIPLEQGLRRQNNEPLGSVIEGVRDHIPLEQGLRLLLSWLEWLHQQVRDHIPLEQGLRLNKPEEHIYKNNVRDHIPLEQG